MMEIFLKTLRSPPFYKFLKTPNPSPFPSSPPISNPPLLDSRVFSSFVAFLSQKISNISSSVDKESTPQIKESDCEISSCNSISDENQKISKQTSKIQRSAKNKKSNASSKHLETKKEDGGRSLHSLFAKPRNSRTKSTVSKRKKYESSVESVSLKEEVSNSKVLSPEMIMFVNHLHAGGYLRKANFLQEGRLDLDSLSSKYAQGFLKFAAERFGFYHQDIAKWLSGSDLKKVVLVGCPSVDTRAVFATKSLRTFFGIDEETVCQQCKLKGSCKFVNKTVDKKEKLDLADVLRVLTVYASNSVPQKRLGLSNEVKFSINKLLNEVVNLSK